MARQSSSSDQIPHAGSSDEVVRKKRTKVSLACDPCTKRKRKCSGSQPCSECSRIGFKCTYTFQNKRSRHSIYAHSIASPTIRPSSVKKTSSDGILDESSRFRYVGSDSTIAFTSNLHRDVHGGPFRVHDFGWHVGLREEARNDLNTIHTPTLRQIVPTLEQLQALLVVYFTVVNSIFPLTDETSVSRSAKEMYSSHATQQHDSNMSASSSNEEDGEVILLVAAALGSFFSGTTIIALNREAALIERAEATLNNPVVKRLPQKRHLQALGLLILYYRFTTRPHVAWMVSCEAMHLCEALGLHQYTRSSPSREIDRTTFWMLKSINTLISFELGRSAVKLRNITQKPFCNLIKEKEKVHSAAHFFISIVEMLPDDDRGDDGQEEEEQDSFDAITYYVDQTSSLHLVLPMVLADVVFCLYRRRRHRGLALSLSRQESILRIGQMALEASKELIAKSQPWFNLTNTILQFVCVLIVMDSAHSWDLLGSALQQLHSVQKTFDTSMTRETLNVARKLVQHFLDRKRRGIERLSQITREAEGGLDQVSILLPESQATQLPSSTINSNDFPALLDNHLLEQWANLVGTEFGLVV